MHTIDTYINVYGYELNYVEITVPLFIHGHPDQINHRTIVEGGFLIKGLQNDPSIKGRENIVSFYQLTISNSADCGIYCFRGLGASVKDVLIQDCDGRGMVVQETFARFSGIIQRCGMSGLCARDGGKIIVSCTEYNCTCPLKNHPGRTRIESNCINGYSGDFGIEVDVVSVKPGPVVTLFEINPAKGIKVSQITSLSKDLARTMSVTSLRVVDNIPGTSSIGIEVPNESREIVSLKEIIISKKYENSDSPITIALGKDIQGKPICTDLQKLPHLLVAGTTGSGKSVTLHTMLVSLLYKSDPTDLQLLLVDPKMLELSVYDGIPHLLNPVITDMSDATNGLRWCVQQMEKRYRIMSELKVRDILAYNQLVLENEQSGNKVEITSHKGDDVIYHEKLPYIVVVIDEFADMMLQVGKKVEDLIIRLAAKARASGIHLILATQRPSVNVITGLIKANIPARIALQVTTNIDSRTIIDSMGAENLLGNGDMLFMSPGSRVPKRIHGAYVSDNEVKEIVQFLKKNSEATYIESLLNSVEDDAVPDIIDSKSNDDPLYNDAVQIVMETKKTSISFIQRKLRIGYNRAANIIEAMEAKGVLSEQQSNGNREILNQDV